MQHPDAPLVLAGAAVMRPPATLAYRDWLDEVASAYFAAVPSPERALCEIVYRDAGLDARAMCTAPRVPETTRFRAAVGQSQRDLAGAALDALFARAPGGAAAGQCELLLYAAASMDCRFHQSAVGWLACAHRLTQRPHFALSQLQGASLAMAAEIVDATLPHVGGAVFVAAEAWPTPFPRGCTAPAALGDAAAALWFTRDRVPGLHLVGTHQQSHDPFLSGAATGRWIEPARDQLLTSAAQTIEAALARYGFTATDIDGWLPSALDSALDDVLRRRCAPHARYAALPREDDGYLCSAAAPMLCAEVLDALRTGAWDAGSVLLSWGASLGGAVGVSLWRVATAGARQT